MEFALAASVRLAVSARYLLKRRSFLATTLTLFAAIGCKQGPRAPLRLGTRVWPGYEPLFLARALGKMPPSLVQLVEFPSAVESMLSYQNGVIDALTLTLDEVLRLLQRGHDPAILLVMDYSAGADVILAQSSIESVAALKGRVIGLESNNLGAYVLTRALELNGLKAEDVRTVSLRADRLEGEFLRGKVDAIATYEPYRTRLLARGARQIFDSTAIPGEIADVLVVRRSAVAAFMPELQTLSAAWFAALEFIEKQPREAAAIMAPREGMTPEQFTEVLRLIRYPKAMENRALLGSGEGSLKGHLQQLMERMVKDGLMTSTAPLEGLLDDRLVREVGR